MYKILTPDTEMSVTTLSSCSNVIAKVVLVTATEQISCRLPELEIGSHVSLLAWSEQPPEANVSFGTKIIHQPTVEHTGFSGLWKITFSSEAKAATVFLASETEKPVALVQSIDAPQHPLNAFLIKPPPRFFNWPLNVLLILSLSLAVLNWSLYSSAFEPLVKRYAVIFTSVVTAVGIIGAPKLQGFFGLTTFLSNGKKRATVSVITLTSLSLFAIYTIKTPLRCIWEAYKYENYILNASSSIDVAQRIEAAKSALIVNPDRIEAYLLLSKSIDDLRYSNRTLLMKFAEDFMADMSMQNAIIGFLERNKPCACLNVDLNYWQKSKRDVLSWYFYREAESFGIRSIPLPIHPRFEGKLSTQIQATEFYKLRKAIWSFETRDYVSTINLFKLKSTRPISPLQSPLDVAKTIAGFSEMQSHIYGDRKRKDGPLGLRKEFPNDYVVQAGIDKLFSHHLRTCNFPSARRELAELLLLRQQSRDAGYLWLDSAEKFEVLAFIRSIRATEETLHTGAYLPAYNLRELFSKCDEWSSEKALFVAQMQTDFANWFKPDDAEWRKGSVEGEDWAHLHSITRTSIKQNWRF